MKQTEFLFFKNTPLIDFQNTIHFSSNSERDNFFLNGNHYDTLKHIGNPFNFIRDRSTITINVPYHEMEGVNYCTFLSDFDDGQRFYAYVMRYEYLNDSAIRVYLLIDGIMTYTQGNVLEQIPNLDIQRQHLTLEEYDKSIWELKNNQDIIKTHTKRYFKTDTVIFDDLLVVITASVDLKQNFGNADDPNMRTSFGKRFDGITSPLNLYACDLDDFNRLMQALSNYPWISQNIKSMSLIPRIFMDQNLTLINFASSDTLSNVNYLYDVTGVRTNKTSLLSELETVSKDMSEMYDLFLLDPVQERHLLRNEYTTTELYNYSGGHLFVDNGQLNQDVGFKLDVDLITGYHNEMKLFIDRYRTEKGFFHGSYVNDSLVFDVFDDLPMLIDNYQLSLAKNANQRALAESKLVTNRVANILDPNADLKTRFFDAASIATNLRPTDLFGKFEDEHEFFRTQQAEQADMALETPTMMNHTNGNSFNIANNKFGIHIKHSRPSSTELAKVKKYYKMFGYLINDKSSRLDRVDSMNICNYVQFGGSWTIPNADVFIVEMMKAQFQNGVRLWHNKNTPNPMKQNVLGNVMVR